MRRVPVAQRLRSMPVGGVVDVDESGSPYDVVLKSHIWQDDVKVVGFYIAAVALIKDTHINTDGMVHATTNLTRQSVRGVAGELGRLSIHSVWSAAIVVGGEIWKCRYLMFPHGYGWEFDEGEGINVLAWIETTCAVSWKYFGESILYYVEL